MPEDHQEFDPVLEYMLAGRRPKYAKQRRNATRRAKSGALVSLFADHFNLHGGGWGPYSSGQPDALARHWATKWAIAMKSDVDASAFLRLGGRPEDLSILVEWDSRGLPRESLARPINHKNLGATTVIEELRRRRMTTDQAARLLKPAG